MIGKYHDNIDTIIFLNKKFLQNYKYLLIYINIKVEIFVTYVFWTTHPTFIFFFNKYIAERKF